MTPAGLADDPVALACAADLMLQRKEAQPPNCLVRTNAIKIRVRDLLDADDGFWKDCFAAHRDLPSTDRLTALPQRRDLLAESPRLLELHGDVAHDRHDTRQCAVLIR